MKEQWQCLNCAAIFGAPVTHCPECGKHNKGERYTCSKCGRVLTIKKPHEPSIKQIGGSVEVS